MAPNTSAAVSALILPAQVVGPIDVGRVGREVESLNEVILSQELRKQPAIQLPKLSLILDQLVELNKINLLDATHRQGLLAAIKNLKDKAPVLHISFSSDPSTDFMEKLIAWLRREVHPQVLVTIGLQPNIGAGCIVRSTNRQFDMSLRQDILQKRDILLKLLDAAMPQPTSNIAAETTPTAATPVVAAAPPAMAQPPAAAANHATTVHQTVNQPVASQGVPV